MKNKKVNQKISKKCEKYKQKKSVDDRSRQTYIFFRNINQLNVNEHSI